MPIGRLKQAAIRRKGDCGVERRNPHIKVHYQPLTGDWIEKLTTELIAGTAPDVFEMWGDFAVNWAENGLLLDLQPYVDRDFDADYIRGFYPGQWEATVLVAGPNAGMRYGILATPTARSSSTTKTPSIKRGCPPAHQLDKRVGGLGTRFLESARSASCAPTATWSPCGVTTSTGGRSGCTATAARCLTGRRLPPNTCSTEQEAVEALEFLRSLDLGTPGGAARPVVDHVFPAAIWR